MRAQAPRVLVVGGGPAGVGVALALADAGVVALVIDSTMSLRDRPGECLTPNFRSLLERLRLMDVLAEHRRIPAFVSRWDLGATVERPLIAEPYGEGWLLNRRRFDARLISETLRRGVRWRLGCTRAPISLILL